MINACVSHELKNPLNSILAQNIKQMIIYERMQTLIECLQDYPHTHELKETIDLLFQGMKL